MKFVTNRPFTGPDAAAQASWWSWPMASTRCTWRH